MTSEPTAEPGDESERGDHERPSETEWPPFPDQGAEAFLAMSQGRYEHQMATLDALDTKAGALFAGGVAEAGFLLAMLALRQAGRPLSWQSWVGIVAVALATTWTLAWSWSAQRIRDWDGYPEHKKLWEAAYGQTALAWHAGLTLAASQSANEKDRKAKSRQVKMAGVGILVQTVLVAAASIAIVAT